MIRVDAEDKLDMTAYTLCYLMQQTKRFGVPCNPPADEPIEPTKEQLAWIRWWSEKVNEIAKNNPEKFEGWEKFPLKIDPNYKPDGDYREYIGVVEQECPLFEQE